MFETKLSRLNALLKSSGLGLPAHRTTVSPAGSNLPWLRKILRPRQDVSEEIRDLLDLDISNLVRERYEPLHRSVNSELYGLLSPVEASYKTGNARDVRP